MKNEKEIEKAKKWKKFWGWLCVLSFINIASHTLFPGLPEGIISLIVGYPIAMILGANVGGLIITLTGIIFNLLLIWIIVYAIAGNKYSKLINDKS